MESFIYQFAELIAFVILSIFVYFKQKGYLGKFLTVFPSKEYFYKMSSRLDVIEMKLVALQTQFNNISSKNGQLRPKNAI